MKKLYGKRLLSIIMLILALLLPTAMLAAEVDNVAFSKAASSAMKDRFGVCEEFLDVKWLNRSAYTGILKADVYRNASKESRYLIVRLERPGSRAFVSRGSGVFYEIDEKQYLSRDFAQLLASAHYSFNHEKVFLTARKGKKSERFPQEPLPFEAFEQHESDFPNRSFSGFARTVCIAYPDGKGAFVVEARKPFMKPAIDETTKQAYETVGKTTKEQCEKKMGAGNDCNPVNLKDSYALDVNGDGKDDYIVMLGSGKTVKAHAGRYLLLSGKDGYVATDVSGCLGVGRFFYGLADGRSFRLGRCGR
ncbi:MAG TPA: hypothetical protein VK448_10720 [Dissulfurispiraceae bacterium]|nr:hypothetical protein [Dissulfurispiraceae bacterium]